MLPQPQRGSECVVGGSTRQSELHHEKHGAPPFVTVAQRYMSRTLPQANQGTRVWVCWSAPLACRCLVLLYAVWCMVCRAMHVPQHVCRRPVDAATASAHGAWGASSLAAPVSRSYCQEHGASVFFCIARRTAEEQWGEADQGAQVRWLVSAVCLYVSGAS